MDLELEVRIVEDQPDVRIHDVLLLYHVAAEQHAGEFLIAK